MSEIVRNKNTKERANLLCLAIRANNDKLLAAQLRQFNLFEQIFLGLEPNVQAAIFRKNNPGHYNGFTRILKTRPQEAVRLTQLLMVSAINYQEIKHILLNGQRFRRNVLHGLQAVSQEGIISVFRLLDVLPLAELQVLLNPLQPTNQRRYHPLKSSLTDKTAQQLISCYLMKILLQMVISDGTAQPNDKQAVIIKETIASIDDELYHSNADSVMIYRRSSEALQQCISTLKENEKNTAIITCLIEKIRQACPSLGLIDMMAIDDESTDIEAPQATSMTLPVYHATPRFRTRLIRNKALALLTTVENAFHQHRRWYRWFRGRHQVETKLRLTLQHVEQLAETVCDRTAYKASQQLSQLTIMLGDLIRQHRCMASNVSLTDLNA